MRPDFLGLQAFLAIAERGSFHRAAAHLGITQTALSHRVRKFEEQLREKLFIRTTRAVALTPAGLALLPRARQLLDDARDLFEDLGSRAATRHDSVAIGCLPTAAVHVMPAVLVEFARLYPGTAVRIFDNSAGQIAERVQKGEAEFGITILGTGRWDLEIRPLLKEPFMLICPASHELAGRRAVNWSELEGVRMIRVSAQTGNRSLLDDALGARSEALDWMYEVQHVASAVSLVAAGAGLTVLPRVALEFAGMPKLAAVPLRNPSVTRMLGAVMRRGIPLSAPAETLLGLVAARLGKRKGAVQPLVHEIG
jgi:DNA-binding transcriptional LysR family regulator